MFFLTAFVALLASALTAATPTNAVSTNRVLIIEHCSTTAAGAKCTLSIGRLESTGDTFRGDYTMKVSPYFFKGEKGKLAILIPRESIQKASQGLVVQVTGTATENGKGGKSRHIDAIATPSNSHEGALKLWFVADGRPLLFDTRYRLAEP